MRKRIVLIVLAVVAVVVLAVVGVAGWGWSTWRASLPQLDGELVAQGISAPVRIDRDGLGIPTLRAENRNDLAFATGFVHGQDRFFQMDLLRRNSAGELSEIVGPAVLDEDRKVRIHQFRSRARAVYEHSNSAERELLDAYAAGVNAGLASLGSKPLEYHMLRVDPQPWLAEDSPLVIFTMFLDLQGDQGVIESTRGVLRDVLPEPVYAFLAPPGTPWDAPLMGDAFETRPIPGADVFDVRQLEVRRVEAASSQLAASDTLDRAVHGSNNWAVGASRTKDGRAIVANDMHLDIRVPHIWYRASFVWSEAGADGAKQERRITGVTLPGTPTMVVGSNSKVAWGFTNSEGDWADLIVLDQPEGDDDSYLTPEGPRKFEHQTEIIKVKGEPDEKFEVLRTIWGPVIDDDHQGRPRVLHWVAYEPDGVNLNLMRLEQANNIAEAMDLANRSGIPAQNFVCADSEGHIGWTIAGMMPNRVGYDGRLPNSWTDGSHRWDGWLDPSKYPRIVDPPDGRIWTANARTADADALATMGDGGYDLGARAKQIRDDLRALEVANEQDMLDIQLDDRAVFLTPWRDLLVELLAAESTDAAPRQEARKFVVDWGGKADINSVGFRLVRAFRREVLTEIAALLTVDCLEADQRTNILEIRQFEGPVWALVTQKPAHLLDPRYKTWDEFLLAQFDAVLAAVPPETRLADYTWGEYNTTRIDHPLSQAVEMLASTLNMPAQPLSGDSSNIPRIQEPDSGASERMGVSPGHEEEGYLHMPVGQSGHALSPHYRDSHPAWVEGKPSPFLPGETIHTLTLEPAT